VAVKHERVSLKTPRFRSVAQEAKWWAGHHELLADLLIKLD
jgi:hypothetical protein